MREIYGTPTRIVAGAQIHTGEGFLFSLLIGTDSVNDPVIAVFDDVGGATAANQIIPSTEYDASVMGMNGLVLKFSKKFTTGLYVAIANIGTGSVIVDGRSQGNLFPVAFV